MLPKSALLCFIEKNVVSQKSSRIPDLAGSFYNKHRQLSKMQVYMKGKTDGTKRHKNILLKS